jgi:hypothetical protein
MLKFTFELDKKVYQDSDAIKGRFALTNTGNTPILINKLLVLNRAFELDENRQVHLIIHNAQGDNFGFAGSIRMREIEDSDFAELAPGQSIERVYDLKDYYLLPAAGQYTIQAVYQNSLDPSNGSAWKGKQESETFTFEIK